MAAAFVAAFLLLSLVSAQEENYIFIPSKYVVRSNQKPDHNEVRLYTATLCAPEVDRYDGYVANIDINLPFNLDWKTTLGVVFVKVSNTTDFTHSYCTNINSTGYPVRTCSFNYTKDIGPTLHFQVTAGTAGSIQYTFGIEFVQSASESRPFKQVLMTSERSLKKRSLPGDYKPDLLAIVRLDTPGKVNTTDSVRYEFNICPSSENNDVIVTIVGTYTDSAFSTYLCNSKNCIPDVPGSHVVGFDVSDTSFNVATAGVSHFMPGGTVFVLITGFGGTEVNEFELAARLLSV